MPRSKHRAAAGPARGLVGRSPEIQRLREQVRHLAATRAPVLLEGEAGTGKSVVARALHDGGPRRERRFERVDCDALPAEAQAEALFGAVGAPGAFERAAGGSVLVHGIESAAPGVPLLVRRVADGVPADALDVSAAAGPTSLPGSAERGGRLRRA